MVKVDQLHYHVHGARTDDRLLDLVRVVGMLIVMPLLPTTTPYHYSLPLLPTATTYRYHLPLLLPPPLPLPLPPPPLLLLLLLLLLPLPLPPPAEYAHNHHDASPSSSLSPGSRRSKSSAGRGTSDMSCTSAPHAIAWITVLPSSAATSCRTSPRVGGGRSVAQTEIT